MLDFLVLSQMARSSSLSGFSNLKFRKADREKQRQRQSQSDRDREEKKTEEGRAKNVSRRHSKLD